MDIFRGHLLRWLWLLILSACFTVVSATAATTNNEDRHALGSCEVSSQQAMQQAKQSKKKKTYEEGEAQEVLPHQCIPIYVPGLTPGEEAMARACMTYIQEEGSLQIHLRANDGYTLEGTQFWAGLDPRKLPLESDHATPDFANHLFAHHANAGPTADFGYKLPKQASTCSKDEFPLFVSLRTFVGLAKAKGRYQSKLSLKTDRPAYVTKVAVHCTCDTGVQQVQDKEERQRRITSFYDASSSDIGYHYTDTSSSYANTVSDSAGSAETVALDDLTSSVGSANAEEDLASSVGSDNATTYDEGLRHTSEESSFFTNYTREEKGEEGAEDEDYRRMEENGFNVNTTDQEPESLQHMLEEEEYGYYTNYTRQDEDLAASDESGRATSDYTNAYTSTDSAYNNMTTSDERGRETDESTVYDEAPTLSPTISPSPTTSPSAVLAAYFAASSPEMCLVGGDGEYFDGEKICFDLRADHVGSVTAGFVCVEVVATTLEVTVKASNNWALVMNELWVGMDGIDNVPLVGGALDYASFPYFNGDYNGEKKASWLIDLKPYCHDGLNKHQLAMVCHSLIERLDANGKPQESSGANVYGYKHDNPDEGAPWFGWFDFTFECECNDGIQGGRVRGLRGNN